MTVIPIYYINLLSSTARRTWFENQANQLHLTVSRIDACSGSDSFKCDLPIFETKGLSAFWMCPPEVGCFLSHRAIWTEMQVSADQWAFVAEDDLHLASDCKPFFVNSDWIPKTADLVKAETTFKRCHIERDVTSIHSGRAVHRLLSWHGGSGGYFISKSTARMLLDASNGFYGPVDQILFNPDFGVFDTLTVFQIVPAIGLQDLFFDERISGFEKSSMAIERRAQKKLNRFERLRRELVRPFHRIPLGIENRLRAISNRTIYSSIDYFDRADNISEKRSKGYHNP